MYNIRKRLHLTLQGSFRAGSFSLKQFSRVYLIRSRNAQFRLLKQEKQKQQERESLVIKYFFRCLQVSAWKIRKDEHTEFTVVRQWCLLPL